MLFCITKTKTNASSGWKLQRESVETINQNLGPQYYIWSDKNFTIDFSASYDISKSVKLFVELNNLGNESLRQYMGIIKKKNYLT